jgi:hypothetical protein
MTLAVQPCTRSGNKLSKRVWDSYDAIVAACKVVWLFLVGDTKHIDSISYSRRALVSSSHCSS